ncbi:MAG TPA: outer membrane beta-barrel protein [Longimicrobium sp.]
MTRSILFRAAAVALAAAAISAAGARAQAGPFVGVGVGMGSINDPDAGNHRVSPVLHGRVGWGFSRSLAAVLEVGVHGLGDEQPRTSDISVINDFGATQVNRRPEVINTVSLLASVQVGDPEQVYVRPGIGLGRHAFPIYLVGASSVERADISHEAGLAAGVALGRVVRVARGFPVAVEAVTLWSHGEDSAGSRWGAGVQVVPLLHF